MAIFDRYLLRLFTKVLLICFLSFFLLFVLIAFFNDIDVFISMGERAGGILAVVWAYFSPQVLTFFDRGSAVLGLLAGLFALGWMQRTNELTAVMAAGISRARIVAPLLWAVIFLSFANIVNRECIIPRFREQLTCKPEDWLGEKAKQVHPRYDNETHIWLSGRSLFTKDRRIMAPSFQLPPTLSAFGRNLRAKEAVFLPANSEHPSGYRLKDVTLPADIDEMGGGRLDGRLVILTPFETQWLNPKECFVVTRVDFDQLAGGNSWHQYASSWQLIRALRNPSLDYGADVRRAIHARLVQPVLDVLLFLLGLSLVFTQRGRNVFVAAGLCMIVVVIYFMVTIACQALGNNYLLSPAFSAWCPLIVFAPVTYYMASPIWD